MITWTGVKIDFVPGCLCYLDFMCNFKKRAVPLSSESSLWVHLNKYLAYPRKDKEHNFFFCYLLERVSSETTNCLVIISLKF